MNIHFFEEYPSEKTLAPARGLPKGTFVFLAAENLEKYEIAKNQLAATNSQCKAAWWPMPKKSLWISGFSDTTELLQLKHDVQQVSDPVLLDLELPLLRKTLFFKNFFSMRRNKRIIMELLHILGERAFTAEYPPSILPKWLMQWTGILYPGEHKRIPMYYSSFAAYGKRYARGLRKAKSKLGEMRPSWLGLGTLSVGALGDEPILTPRQLEEDLRFAQGIGATNVVVFRLAGLTDKHREIFQHP